MEMVYIGSNGKAVEQLQYLLNYIGYDLHVDGIFGDDTHTAVADFQEALNLKIDGIVGDITWTFLMNVKTLRDENPTANFRKNPLHMEETEFIPDEERVQHKANRDL